VIEGNNKFKKPFAASNNSFLSHLKIAIAIAISKSKYLVEFRTSPT
jgi:hypothetical protein